MKSKQLILLSALGAVLLSIAWFFLLWSPASAKLDKARADKQAVEQRRTELQARLGRLQKHQANAENIERDRVALAAAIPDKDNLDQFLHQLSERANAAGVALVNISPSPPAAPAAGAAAAPAAAAAPPSVGLQMQVAGDYFAVLHFLEAVRDGERLVTIDNLSMSKGGEGNTINATIGAKMFVAPPTPSVPSAATSQTASA